VLRVNRALMYLMIIIIAFLHATVLNGPTKHGLKPDLLLTAVIFFGLFGKQRIGLEAGILAGIMQGVFSLNEVWVSALAYGMVGYVAGRNHNRFYRESIFVQSILTFAGVIVTYIMAYFCYKYLTESAAYQAIMPILLPCALYTAIIAPLVFFILKKTVKPVIYQ